MRGISDKAWAAGWNVVRLNQRNCGGTEHLSRGLYHSGLTHDPLFVLRELIERDGIHAMAVAGYSLGGNLALKLAGELGDRRRPELAGGLRRLADDGSGACAWSARAPGELSPYQWNFVRNLKARMRRKAAAFPGAFSLEPLGRIWTVRQFDEVYTAPHHGFRDAADYYYRASALRVIDRIRVPTLILTAAGRPVRPGRPFRDPRSTGQPATSPSSSRPHGGHCAFLERRRLRRLSTAYLGRARKSVRFSSDIVHRSRASSVVHRERSARTPAPSPPLRA